MSLGIIQVQFQLCLILTSPGVDHGRNPLGKRAFWPVAPQNRLVPREPLLGQCLHPPHSGFWVFLEEVRP
jgi:hypothetical protein